MASESTTVEELLAELTPRELADQIARKGAKGRDAFLRVLDSDITECIRELENQAQHYQEDNEEKLTSFIAAQLRRQKYNATCEEVIRGHVDLKVENRRNNLLWLAEAKIHASYKNTEDGLRQLLDRYSSGRDTEAGVLIYIKKSGANKVLNKWREHLQKNNSCALTSTSDGPDQYSFLSHHRHSSGFNILVKHRLVLLHFAPTDKSARTRKERKRKNRSKPNNGQSARKQTLQ